MVNIRTQVKKRRTKRDGDWSIRALAKGALREAVGGLGVRRQPDFLSLNSQTKTQRVGGRSGSISIPETMVMSRNVFQAQGSSSPKVLKLGEGKEVVSTEQKENKVEKVEKIEKPDRRRRSMRATSTVGNVPRDLYEASKSRKSIKQVPWKKT
ncbi:PREDICTED: uncharacterized protein LOC108561912 [Nicrophorus vespilloides]|uniref:Uncharacterized protein LOC108561912 n=1 Tax=Nicrophorus vespilloides TaxID=110193 RepID=A0ABM1MLS3_NICVS|nr:PREDICTED: uncharacterized protein LOC108561912 [Nicrophorus vespilloides]